MKIIAIDPGTTESAIIFFENGIITFKSKCCNSEILEFLKIQPSQDDSIKLFIEMVASYGMPVGKEIFDTCVWIGRFIECYSGNYELVYRRDIKLHLCNSVKAKDSNIRQALIDRFGAPGAKKNPGFTYGIKSDIWAAFALAVYAYDKIKKS